MAVQASILDPVVHGRIIADMANVLRDANINPEYLHMSMKEGTHPAVVNYVRRFKFHKGEGVYGLLAHGKAMDDPSTRMQAIAGALVRNFIRARVVTLEEFLEDDPELGTITCLCVPNFYVGNGLADWKIGQIMDRLLQRRLTGRQTVLYATNLKHMDSHFGSDIAQVLTRDFIKVG